MRRHAKALAGTPVRAEKGLKTLRDLNNKNLKKPVATTMLTLNMPWLS